MFSSQERLKERTGRDGTSRFEYLQDLVSEFQSTSKEDAKEQIVANLANFAYDPINYHHIRTLHVLDLFCDCLTERNEKLQEFGMGGIANACADPKNAKILREMEEGIPAVIACLSSPVENTVLSAVSTLYFLCEDSTWRDIVSPAVMEGMERFSSSSDVNVRLSNLARCFLEKVNGFNKRRAN